MRWTGLLPLLLIAPGGCFWDAYERDQSGIRNKRIETPELAEASVESAARVDQAGRLLVGQNPFLGIEPVFQTFGVPEPELWHPDFHAIFVTEGLVQRCKSDDELAAVLALELAQMIEEKRATAAYRQVGPMQLPPDSNLPSGGTIASHSHDLGIQALADQKLGSSKFKTPTQAEVDKRAEEILESAGYDPQLIQQMRPLVQQARQNRRLGAQFGDRSDKPTWSR